MFWRSTPRTIKICLDGATDKMAVEHNGRAWLAWHVEALARAKKLPDLHKLMIHRAPRVPQTPAEMQSIIKTWVAANGGEIRKKN